MFGLVSPARCLARLILFRASNNGAGQTFSKDGVVIVRHEGVTEVTEACAPRQIKGLDIHPPLSFLPITHHVRNRRRL